MALDPCTHPVTKHEAPIGQSAHLGPTTQIDWRSLLKLLNEDFS